MEKFGIPSLLSTFDSWVWSNGQKALWENDCYMGSYCANSTQLALRISL